MLDFPQTRKTPLEPRRNRYQQPSSGVLENSELFVWDLLFAGGRPKIGGSHARVDLEGMGKMTLIIESRIRSNVGNGLGGVSYLARGIVQAELPHIVTDGGFVAPVKHLG